MLHRVDLPDLDVQRNLQQSDKAGSEDDVNLQAVQLQKLLSNAIRLAFGLRTVEVLWENYSR